MRNQTFVLLPFLLLPLLSCGGAGEGRLELPSPRAIADDVAPSDEVIELTLTVENPGGQDVRLTRVSLLHPDHDAGTFSLPDDFQLPRTVGPESSLDIPFLFHPDANAPDGCNLFATTDVEIGAFREPSFLPLLTGELVVAGSCTTPLRCSAEAVPVTVMSYDSPFRITCYNFAPDNLTISGLLLDPATAPFELPDNAFPLTIPSQSRDHFELRFAPQERGEYETLLTLQTSDHGDASLSLSARAIRERPLCSDPVDDLPVIPDSINGYTFDLESTSIQTAFGQVRATRSINEDRAPMVERAYLLATGSFLNDYCEVSLGDDGSYRWEGISCAEGEGTSHNVLTIPLSDDIRAQVRTVSLDDTVRFEGYDIDRIKREGWWSDGNSTGDVRIRAMFITRVCDPVAN